MQSLILKLCDDDLTDTVLYLFGVFSFSIFSAAELNWFFSWMYFWTALKGFWSSSSSYLFFCYFSFVELEILD